MLLGVESEYAFGGNQNRNDLLQRFVSSMKERIPYLPGTTDWDLFLENGSRFYIDCGGHPELSTPECTSPSEAVRYILAGEAILADVVNEISAGEAPDGNAMLFRCNVDYSGAKTTWGSHESYYHRADPSLFPEQLIPHLVTRSLYAGAGGFNPYAAGLEFTLSPRAWHLSRVTSSESTHDRGIFHTKNEPLARAGANRLHLLCGESLCSQVATWLRLGTTSLVVAMIDARLQPGAAVQLISPLKALRALVADPSCRALVEVKDGRRLSAIDIQRHYLHEAEKHLGDRCMPPWAEEVCDRWRSMLDLLDERNESLATTLDWAIKRAIYRDRVAKKGFDWDRLSKWNHIADRIRIAIGKSKRKGRVTVELILDKKKAMSPIPDTVRDLTPFLEKHSLSWDMLRPFVDLRKELFEVDMRFGQLGSGGIFSALDRAGVIHHQASEVDDVHHARVRPPASTRAHIRGKAVRSYAGREGFQCYWDHIWDFNKRRLMDLSNPFGRDAKWKVLSEDDPRNPPFRRRRREAHARLRLFEELIVPNRGE